MGVWVFVWHGATLWFELFSRRAQILALSFHGVAWCAHCQRPAARLPSRPFVPLPHPDPMLKLHSPLALLTLMWMPLAVLAQDTAAGTAVTVERIEGEAFRSRGGGMAPVERGQTVEPGVQIRAGGAGRVELSVGGSPTIAIGNGGELTIDAIQAPTLRVTLWRGAVHIDTRATAAWPQRDVRIQLGELNLRVDGAEVWAALNNDIAQVCLISGSAEAQLSTHTDRLELSGQCLSRAGLESRWVMVPAEVLNDRTALVHVRVKESIASQPALPDLRKTLPEPEPKPAAPIPPLPEVVAPPLPEPPAAAAAAAESTSTSPPASTPKPASTHSAPAPAPTPSPSQEPQHESHWSVVLASLDNRAAAEVEAARLRKQGVSVEIREYVSGAKRGYRVGHGRYGSRAEAQAAFNALKRSHPKLSGWMANY